MDVLLARQSGHNQPVFSTERARTAFAVSFCLTLFAYGAVALRFYAQRKKGVKNGFDSWILIPACITYTGMFAIQCVFVFDAGYGHHEIYDSIGQLFQEAQLAIVVQMVYGLTMFLTRISLIVLLIRSFRSLRWFKVSMWILLAANAVWLLWVLFGYGLMCIPFSYAYKTNQPGHCNISFETVLIISGSWTIIMELFMWLLPLVPIWRIQADRALKLGLTFIFGVGLLDIAVSIVRLVTVVHIVDTWVDFSWTSVSGECWGMAEPGISIFLACVPIYRPLFDGVKFPDNWHRWLAVGRPGRSQRYGSSRSLFGSKSKDTSPSPVSTERWPDPEKGGYVDPWSPEPGGGVTDPVVWVMQKAHMVDVRPPSRAAGAHLPMASHAPGLEELPGMMMVPPGVGHRCIRSVMDCPDCREKYAQWIQHGQHYGT